MTQKNKKSGPSNAVAVAVKRSPGRPRLADRGNADQTRDMLLDAGLKLFARYGYDPVTTGAIAEAAGLTQSMVHYHFGSKSKLWEEAIKRMMQKRGALFRMATRDLAGLDPVDKLKALTRRLIEANAENPDFVRIAVHEGTARSPRLKWLVDNYFAPGFGVFDEAVREAIAAKAIPDLPVHDVTNAITSAASLTFGLRAMVEGIYGIEVRDAAHIRSFSDSVIQILFDGLLNKPAAAKPGRTAKAPALTKAGRARPNRASA